MVVPVNYTLDGTLTLRKSMFFKIETDQTVPETDFFFTVYFFLYMQISVASVVCFANGSLPTIVQGTEMSLR